VSGSGPAFHIRPHEQGVDLRKVLGARDIVLGQNRAFDKHFVIDSDDPPRLRTLLPPGLRSEILAIAPRLRITGTSEALVLEHPLLPDRDLIDALIGFAVTIADCPAYSLKPFRSLAGSTYTASSGALGARSLPRLVFTDPPQVEVRPQWQNRRFAICASIRGVPRVLELAVKVAEGECTGDMDHLRPRDRDTLARMGRLDLVATASVATIRWNTAPAPEVLLLGVEVLRALARQPLESGHSPVS
jgi:hypothetical protein